MTDGLAADVAAFYGEYGSDFSALDAPAAAAHWHAPSIRAFTDRVAFDATEASRRDGFETAVTALAETDYDHSERVALRTHGLSEALALSNVVWERVTDEGDLMVRFSPLHLLYRTDDGWKLTGRASRRSNDPMALSPGPKNEAPPAIRSFFEEYAAAFSTLDPDVIAGYWHCPTLLAGDGGVQAVGPTEEATALIGRMADDLRSRGYERSEFASVDAAEVDDGVAVAEVVWRRLDADGDLLEEFATFHVLRETDEGWKLVVVARHPVENAVAFPVDPATDGEKR